MVNLSQIIHRIRGSYPRTLPFDFPEAGILVPVINHPTDPEIVLTRRTEQLSTHAGQVAFPGGKKDDEDKDLLATALRESEEEIGLNPDHVEIVGRLSQVVSKYGILVSPYVGLIDRPKSFKINTGELDAVFTVPVRYFLETLPVRKDKLQFRQYTLHVPCYQFEEFEIWGMSAIVIVDFLNVACDAGINLLVP